MKNFLARSLTGTYGVVAFAFIAISSIAGENGTQTISAENTSATSTFPFSGEFVVDETYVGNGDVQRGQHVLRDFDENDILLRFVLTPRIKLGVLRLGAEWERFSFGFPDSAPLPDTLQAVSLVLGLDTQLSDSILLRFQAQPGFYGTDNFESQDVNIPFVVGGTYIYSPNLQLVLGIGVRLNQAVLTYGEIRTGAGAAWRVSSVMTLSAEAGYQPYRDFDFYRADVRYHQDGGAPYGTISVRGEF